MLNEYKIWIKGVDNSLCADDKTKKLIEAALLRGFKSGWQKCAQKKSAKLRDCKREL